MKSMIMHCKVCGTDSIWPKEVDDLEFPADQEWSEDVARSLEWVCENGHIGEPMVDIMTCGCHPKVEVTVPYGECGYLYVHGWVKSE